MKVISDSSLTLYVHPIPSVNFVGYIFKMYPLYSCLNIPTVTTATQAANIFHLDDESLPKVLLASCFVLCILQSAE